MPQTIRICRSHDLAENHSIKFVIPEPKYDREGFAVRKNGNVYAFYNECSHINLPLDWNDNDFLDLDFQHIVCKNHGAQFQIEDGLCTVGPCTNTHLKKLNVTTEIFDGEEWFVAHC